MAYIEKYPLDVTPQGDTERESIEKNRSEILALAKQIELKSTGGSGALRNRVLSATVSNGRFSFIVPDNLTALIDGSVIPVVVTFSNGFDENGIVDNIETITHRLSAWTLPVNATNYLYIERSSVGAISYGSVVEAPTKATTPPSEPKTDDHYYNTLLEKMFVYKGTEWQAVQRVFVAVAKTNSTGIDTLTYINASVGNVTTDNIANGSVTSEKLAKDSVTKDAIAPKSVTANALADDVSTIINNVLDKVYPVGSIYCSTVGTNPNELFGFGAWEYIEQGRVLLSQGDSYKAGTTGGEKEHTITAAEMPAHNHYSNTESSGGHNHKGRTGTSGWHGHVLWSGNGGSGGGYFSQGQRYSNKTYQMNDVDWSGNHEHDFTTNQGGAHTHPIKTDGGGQPHNNMPPYLSVYMWKRVA